jgi:hypothetical protein
MKKILLFVLAILLLHSIVNATQLAGTYTINVAAPATTTNFQNVLSALRYLGGGARTDGGPANTSPFGVSGPVVFNMSPGNYAESGLSINAITGNSTINTISFQKLPASIGEVVFNPSVTSALTVFNFNSISTNFFNFKNIRFQATVTNSSSAVSNLCAYLKNGFNLGIDNCIFDFANIATTQVYGIFGGTCTSIINSTFYNSLVTNRYQGYGVYTSVPTFTNNIVKNTAVNISDIVNVGNNQFEKGTVFISNSSTTACSFADNIFTNAIISVGYVYNQAFSIQRNKIDVNRSQFPDVPGGGISTDYITNPISFGSVGVVAATVKCINNFVSINLASFFNPVNPVYGIAASTTPYNLQVMHNTVRVNSSQINVVPIIATINATVTNNIFWSNSGGKAAETIGGAIWNSNNYYAAITPAYTFTDANAKNENITFVSTTDLHHSSGCLKGIATSVTIDIDNVARNASTPVIGAAEASNIGFDAGVKRIVTPVTQYVTAPSSQAISFKLVNNGMANITSVTANYSINNGTPVSETFTGLSLVECDSVTIAFTGNYAFAQNNSLVKVTLTAVNGTTDPNVSNDVLQKSIDILGPMSGVYTVNPAAATTPFNFPTIGYADTAMMTRSIAGPVTISIYNGTYSQSNMTLNTVPGASSINTIKFTSFSNDSLQVNIISQFQIINVPYVTLEKLKFTGSNIYTNSSIIKLEGAANNLTIKNCNITGRVEYNAGSNVDIKNNYILGGIQFTNYTGPLINSVLIKNNVLVGGGRDGNDSPFMLQCFNVAKPVLDGNTFQDFGFNHVSGGYGFKSTLYFVSCADTLTIKNNKFLRCSTTRLVGDYNTLPTPTSNLSHVEMYNNFITATGLFKIGGVDFNGTGIPLSMRFYFNNFHNIAATGGGFSFGSIGTSSGATGVTLNKNNNFVAKYNGQAAILSGINPAVTDNNNYFTNGSILVSTSSNYATLAAYKAASNEPNAISVNAKYIDSVNLHVLHPSLLGAGVPAPTASPFLFDIDNDNRNALNPAIGADEPMLPSNDVIAKQLIAAKKDFIATVAQPLAIRILNNGAAVLNQVKVRWSIDGIEQLPSYTWSGSLAYDSSTTINFGSYTFSMMKYTSLKVWTDLPNASPDMVPINDTLLLDSIMPFARGQFTIGGASPSLPSLTKAGELLNYGGIDSAVNVLIRNGKYIEQPTIKFIKGASLTNLVTFKGENNNASLDTLAFAATGIGVNPLHVMKLDSAAFVTFKNITFQSTAASNYNMAVSVNNKSRFVTFDSCAFTSVATNTGYAHIEQPSLAVVDSNFIFTNNFFTKGNGGIKMTLSNGLIKGNRFEAMGGTNGAIAMTLIAGANSFLTIDSNFVKNPVICTFVSGVTCLGYGSTQIRGIDLSYASGANADVIVSRNKIYANNSYAIYSQSNGSIAKPIKVYNNFFGARGASAIFAGGQYHDFYNNTIADSADFSNNSLVSIGNSNINFRNNIVVKKLANPDLNYRLLDFSSSFYVSTFNSSNNAYFIADTTKTVYNGSANLTLSAWKALGKDANSKKIIPAFVSYFSDLHIDKNKAGAVDVFKAGTPLAAIPKDIDDSTRSLTVPSIGADEFSLNNDDGGAIAITNLATPVAQGANSIVASIRNYGNNNITAGTINWSVNNITQTPYAWAGNIATGDSAVNINIGNFNFTGINKYDIKIWTSIAGDANAVNDTAFKSIYPALCGNYSISGTTPDFISFSAAAKYASFAGVSCPVVFNIRDGVYNESDTVNVIPGSSAINTITFQSQSLDSSKVVFTQSASFIGANSVSVFKINAAQHIKFKALGIKRIADPLYNFYFDVIACTGNVSGLSFTNCDIGSVGAGKLIDVPFLALQPLPTSDIVFNKNNFTGGAIGISVGAQANATYTKGITITNNKFNKTIGTGNSTATYTIDIGGANAVNVSNNYIDSCISSRYVGGIRLGYVTGKTNVQSNIIIKRKAANGIYLDAIRGGALADSMAIIANNFITIDSTLSPVGIVGYQTGRNVKIIYNNILNNSTSSTSRGIEYNNNYSASTGILKDTIANNNIVSTTAGLGLSIFQNTAADMQCNNNNIFVSGSAILASYNGTNYTTIPTFQTAGGTFVNNVSKNPLYISATDLHVLELTLRTNGAPLSYVTNDIDNDTRGLINTTIGADEIVVQPLDMGVSALVTPAKPFAAGNQNITLALKNYGATPIANATVNWSINGTAQTPFNFTGSIPFGNTVNAIIANYNFVVDSAYNIKFWTSNPNGSLDNNLTNDSTIVVDFYPALTGTYTLGGATPNFKGFSRSMRNLKYGGVLGNVIFNAREAVYYDNLVVDSIPFQNNYTVTWQGETVDSTKAYLYHTSVPGDLVKGTIVLNNAKNIIFKNITIATKRNSAAMYSVIQFVDKNKNIQLIGNRIIDSTYDGSYQALNNLGLSLISNIDNAATTTYYYPSSKDSGLLINGNRLVQVNNSNFTTAVELRGGYGIDYANNITIAHYLNNTTFSNNIFDLRIANKKGFESKYNDSLKVIGNKILGSVTADGKDLIVFDKNDVYHEGYNSVAVAISAGVGRVAGKPAIVSNNMIQTKVVGFYNGDYVNNAGLIVTGDRCNIIHNTLMATDTGYGGSGYTQSVLFQLNGSRDTVKNNIFFNANGGYLLRYTGVTNLISNNNNYFYTNHFSPAATSLAQHKTIYVQDVNSVENINPYFRGAKDLHASNILLKVAPVVSPTNTFYTNDVDGQSRTGTVSFGADEFSQPVNDLVITEMQPAKVFAEGLNDIKIRVYNNGSNAITSFNTTVQLTNYPLANFGYYNPVNAGSLNYTFSGNIASGASQLITLGQLNIPLYRNQIKINCTNTNGVADEVPYNDSLQNDNFYAGLNGTYSFNNTWPTITSGVNFSSFDDVSLQLKLGGVYGPSTLNLKPGIHIGELRIDSIINRGAISPLVIKSEDNDSTNTGIANNVSNVFPSNITIFRASYVTVKKLNFFNAAHNAMLLGFNSQFINVENCRLKGSDVLRDITGFTYEGYGILTSGNWAGMTNYNDSNYTFKNNYFDGGGTALSIGGSSFGITMRNIIIDSNTFINTKGDAVNTILAKNILISNNVIETNTTVPAFRGIFSGSSMGYTRIQKNKVYAQNDGVGISMDDYYGAAYSLTDSIKITNNFISVGGSNMGTRGILLGLKYKPSKILHNSILNRNTNAQSIAYEFANVNTLIKTEVINNIFHNQNSGIPVSIFKDVTTTTNYEQHHNQLFTNGTVYGVVKKFVDIFTVNINSYPTLATLAATGIDYSSVSGDPLFVSDKDLHVDGSNVNNVGDFTFTPQVLIDIDGDARSFSTPDIGADEFTLPNYGIVQLESPLSSCSHTATETVKAWVKNFGQTPRSKIPVAYRINGGTIVRDTANILLNAGDSALFSFTQTANLASPINYNFELWTDYRGDSLRNNDTLQILVATTPANNVLPYYTGFEGTSAGWYTGGQNSSIKWGVIFSGIIDSAANGLNAWKSNLTGPHKNNELSYLYSPCFDMSAISGDPVLNFNFSHQLENNNDKAWVEMSSDAGATWSKVGAQGEGLKWYNNAGNYWTGLDNQWHNVKHILPISALANKTQIRVRFVLQTNGTIVQDGIAIDDISIYTGVNPPVSIGTYTNRTAVSTGTGTFIPVNDPSGNRLVEINDAGQSLGNITVDVNQTIGGVPTTYNGQNYLGRSFVIHVQNQPTTPVTVRLFITQAEVDAWRLLDPSIDIMRNISVQKYSSNVLEDFDITNNTSGTTLNISPAQLTKLPYQDGYIIEFQVNSFSEFWLTKGTPPTASCLGNGITMTAATTGAAYQWQLNTGSGYSNITNNANYAGTTTATLQINNVPTSTSGYKYRCVVDAVNGPDNVLRFVLTWTGAVSNAWTLPGNWSCNTIPDEYTDVMIPTGVSNYPIISINTSVRKMVLQTGTSVNVNTGITVDIKGK